MRAYVDIPKPMSRAMDRVIAALKPTAMQAGITVTLSREHADLVVLHVIGYDDTLAAINELAQRGQRYAMIQYCLRTTQRANTEDWIPLWRGAVAVWSYYDLEAMHAEDHAARHPETPAQTLADLGINFYLAPLGVDASTFRPYNVPRRAAILTSGYVAESESVTEAARAVKRVGGRMLHLGPPDLGIEADGAQVAYLWQTPDGILAQSYSRCQFVSGLRRGEGFELPAAEGLLCGARPICFDRPHYRLWYDGLAEFIPEGTPEEVENALVALFLAGPRPVTEAEIATATARFDWQVVTAGFWLAIQQRGIDARPTARTSSTGAVPRGTPARRMLVVADAIVSTGFARSCRAYVQGAVDAGWDVHVLGLNYHGDPHDWPCKVYPCAPGGDPYGIGRLPELIAKIGPAVVVIQNDPWNLPRYMKACGGVRVVAVIAVDGKNMANAVQLNGLAGAIFWTHFGLNEARRGGYVGNADVIPLGVDLDIYKPQDRAEMRRLLLPPRAKDAFIVGCANRNQPRKRMDLLISYFAQWVKEHKRHDAMLYLHVAPTGDRGYDVQQLMAYHGLKDRLVLQEPEIGYGLSEVSLAAQYATWDVAMTATQGEGWGLTTMEGMACGIPQIVPRWSALGEWPGDAVMQVSCSEIAVTPNYVNVFGAIMDREEAIAALEKLYTDAALRLDLGTKGLSLVSSPQYRWPAIGNAFVATVEQFLGNPY